MAKKSIGKTDLKRIDAMTDEDIARQIAEDPDVAPDMTTTPGFRLVRGPQVLPTKQKVTLRLSPEVVKHFKAGGKGWQTRLNEFLLDHVNAQKSTRKAVRKRKSKSKKATQAASRKRA
ncbi:MAG: BrnA antitoxin family protein [Gammaproteobacteria bacterium]